MTFFNFRTKAAQPKRNIAQIHLFPLGGIEASAIWAQKTCAPKIPISKQRKAPLPILQKPRYKAA